MSLNLRGIIPACVVTFDADGRFDEAAYRRYLQWLLPQGPVALAINADTGEGPHLWPDERERVLRVAVDEAGDVPVIAGLSAQFTAQAVEEAKRAEGAGARGLLVFPIPVYQGTPLDPAIPVAYHEAIARGCGLPMVAFQLQPALGGVIFSEETLRRIAAIDSVVALKEASFDARLYLLTRRMIESLPRPIDLLTGDDNFIYESFVLGAEGALIGFGTLATDLQVEMYGLTREGRWEEARAIWERILPLEEVVYGTPVRDYRARTKVALRELGRHRVNGHAAAAPAGRRGDRGRGPRRLAAAGCCRRGPPDGRCAGAVASCSSPAAAGASAPRSRPRPPPRARRSRSTTTAPPTAPSATLRGCGPPAREGEAFAADLADGASAEGAGPRRHRPLRADRRARQQRRSHAGRPVPRDRPGRLGRRPAHRPHGRVPHLPRRAAGDARAGRRVHRQHRVPARADGRRRDRSLQRREVGAHRPHPGPRPGVRPAGDPRQRRRAGGHDHPDDRGPRRQRGGPAAARDSALGRFGRADEVADAVIFLLSDRASLFLGQTLNPNAGGYMP